MDSDQNLTTTGQLNNDTRRMLIQKENITYNGLITMMKKVCMNKLSSNDKIVVQFKDKDNNLKPMNGDSDLTFALQSNRILKLVLTVNSEEKNLDNGFNLLDITSIKYAMQVIRDENNKIMVHFHNDSGTNAKASCPSNTTGPGNSGNKFELTIDEKKSIKFEADRLKHDLHKYPIKGELSSIVEKEIDEVNKYIRETLQYIIPPSSSYNVAVNQAAFYLAKDNVGLIRYSTMITDLARRVVRACGRIFGDEKEYNRQLKSYFYQQDYLPDIYLSSGFESMIDDNLDCFGYADASVVESSEYEDDQVEHNILDKNRIYAGCKKEPKNVRILDFKKCSIDSIKPSALNCYYNLLELNLQNNRLKSFPLNLFLPNLVTLYLQNNQFTTAPFVEQFQNLCYLKVDKKIRDMFDKDSVSFFCSHLMYINNKIYLHQRSDEADEFQDFILGTKIDIKHMVERFWKEDYAIYFKDGVKISESQKVKVSLVRRIQERQLYDEIKIGRFKDLIARRVAEKFVNSKMMDDDDNEW